MPASLSNRLPFRPLQRRQAITWFSQLLAAPPRDVGTTWSTESWAEGIPLPQYWQVPSSRRRRVRRVFLRPARAELVVVRWGKPAQPLHNQPPCIILLASHPATPLHLTAVCAGL